MPASEGISCQACGASNPPGFRFCGSCGVALERACPSCAAMMPAATLFCGACGADMGSSELAEAEPSTGERKVVTAVFADLAASTELATRLDPEDLRRVYASYYDAMSAAIETHGGVVEKFIGDAVVGLFGAPVTHEDDPDRAVRAGRAMQAALADVNRSHAPELGEELALRVGVHTGEVITSPGATVEALVTGDVISVAARLQTVAPAGGVVIGERTHRDTLRSFDFDALGAFELKGVPGTTKAWLVTGEASATHVDSDRPLVGRTDELALLDVLFRRCGREGGPHLATVVGSAGVGKSRLAWEFTTAAEAPTVRGRCLPYGHGLGLWPLAEIVKTEAGILDSDPPDVMLVKAQAEIGRHFDPEDAGGATLPALLSSIGIPVEPDPLAGIGLDAARRMIVNTWSRYFAALAADGPVIVWIEDVHWADDALLDLLERQLGRFEAPVLFLCLARPELFERRPGWGAGVGSTSALELRALSTDETSRLIENLLDGDVDPSLLSAVAERTGGNPFFATEVVRTLEEDGAIARSDGVWSATGDIAAAMPDTVQAAIAARIDRLEPSVKAVLQMASVVGRTFWIGAGEELSGPDVDAAIETLVNRGLVRPRQASAIAGAQEHTFEHALIRDVAYGTIPKARKPQAHRAALDWMAQRTRGRDEEFAELLAYHAEEAGDIERTARYATLAGHRHRRVYAAEEAIGWYQRASVAVDDLPDDRGSAMRSEILHSRGEAYEQLARFQDALDDYRAALSIARATGRTWMMAQELATIARVLRSLERYEEAEDVIPEALQTARDVGWEYVEANIRCLAGQLAWDRGDPMRARSELEEGLRISQEVRDLEGEALARTGLADIGLCQGPFDRAIADGERARQLWLHLGHRPAAAAAAQTLGFLSLATGDLEAAERLFRGSLEAARDLGIAREEPLSLVGLAVLETIRGNLGAALSYLDEAIAVAAGAGAGAAKGLVAAHTWRIVLWQTMNASERAATDLAALETLSAAATVSYLDPVRVSASAWLCLAAADPEGARERFDRARAGAEGLLLSRFVCGWIEIHAWHERGDREATADAAAWMLAGDDGCPAAEALGEWALASTRGGDPARAVALARRTGDRTLLWRACALAADVAADHGDVEVAARLRDEAAEIVRSLAGSLPEDRLRERFLSDADAAALVRDEAAG